MRHEEVDLEQLSREAWKVRERAWILGRTKVGAALLAEDGNVYTGCNVEQYFRSHDIHAEVNAIGNMIAQGAKRFDAILIAAECKRFTPCGACLDWIFQFGGADCVVAFQPAPDASIERFSASDLMPHYPCSR